MLAGSPRWSPLAALLVLLAVAVAGGDVDRAAE